MDIIDFLKDNGNWVNVILGILVFCSVGGLIMSFSKDRTVRLFGYIGVIFPLVTFMFLHSLSIL